MADALCGPSNALSSFQKHTQVDRTLQQDRLSGPRQAHTQGFRSFDPRSGSLDADFHAFENAPPQPFHGESLSHHTYHGFPQSHTTMSAGAANWASDFQNMSLSDQPVSAHQFRTEAPLVRSAPGGWQNEFMRLRQGGLSPVAQGKQAIDGQQQNMTAAIQPFHSYNGLQSPYAMADGQNYTSFSQHQPEVLEGHEEMAAAGWAEAFDEAFKHVSQVELASTAQQDQILHQDGTYTNDRSQMGETSALIQEPEGIRIGSDAIAYTETKDRTADQETQDASALARVAGELLHNIQHETSDKFQNSQFLSLMRKIRDRQVEVRNNDFETAHGQVPVPIQEQPTASTGSSQAQEAFNFPDLNAVYEPRQADGVDYSFEPDQMPSHQAARSQVQELHPGGRLYPGSPELQSARMSGGIDPSSAPPA